MNKDRRKQIDAIFSALEDLKSQIETIASEERDAFDNMPEGLQQGDKGQAAEAAADALDEAANGIDDITSKLDDAKA